MVFKLVIAASKTWRRLKGTNQLPKLIAGVRFNDGIEVIQMPAKPRDLITSSPKIPHSSRGVSRHVARRYEMDRSISP